MILVSPKTQDLQTYFKERSAKGAARQNAEHIVKYTTACPYKLDGDTICCAYCFDTFTDPSKHRQHINEEHETFDIKIAFSNLKENANLRVDCTDLKCRLCFIPLQNIEAVVEHLQSSHHLDVSVDAGVALLPNKYENGKLTCGYCDISLAGFRQLSTHLTTHYQPLICELCGKPFMTRSGLSMHMQYIHRRKGFPCPKCKQTFESTGARKVHVTNTRQCWMYMCKRCNERFRTYKLRQDHNVSVHSRPVKTYPCIECGEVFPTQSTLYIHFKLLHGKDEFVCNHCGTKYYSKLRLQDHMVSHTKEKKYQCSQCNKRYPRLRGLTRHLSSHHKK